MHPGLLQRFLHSAGPTCEKARHAARHARRGRAAVRGAGRGTARGKPAPANSSGPTRATPAPPRRRPSASSTTSAPPITCAPCTRTRRSRRSRQPGADDGPLGLLRRRTPHRADPALADHDDRLPDAPRRNLGRAEHRLGERRLQHAPPHRPRMDGLAASPGDHPDRRLPRRGRRCQTVPAGRAACRAGAAAPMRWSSPSGATEASCAGPSGAERVPLRCPPPMRDRRARRFPGPASTSARGSASRGRRWS